jgi:hypothetical protein
LSELRDQAPHSLGQLYYYAVTPEAEPRDVTPVLVDISAAGIVQSWTEAMKAHGSQARTRNYADIQLLRARSWGARANVGYAAALYPNDPIVVGSLAAVSRGARQF